jgi:succinoglycan biosynthesis transport protein ExoP
MTLIQFLSILKARKWIAILVLMLTVATAVTVSLLLPKQYTATASVVVDVKPDPVNPMPFLAQAMPAYIATQVDVMRSDRVVQRVVRALRLAEDPKTREAWLKVTQGEGLIEAWIAESVKVNMDVKPSRESNVITVTYKDGDPRFAADAANAIVQGYLDTSLELRVDPARRYSAFFDSRAQELRASVEKAQARLSAYQREKGIIATDERLDFETQQLNQLATQLTMLQAMSAESTSRQAQALGGSGDRLQEVVNNPMLAALRADLTRAEGRLQELNSRLGDNHPQVVEAKANIATLRGRLDVETRRVTGSVGVTNSINRAKEAEIRAALEAQRAKVLRMKAVRDEGAVLYRDVENAQRAYDAVLARLNQTNLESQATQGNVYSLAPASPPLVPSSPRLVLNTILSLIIGTALATAAAVMVELSDRRVRTVDEVTELLGLPTLGVLPKPGAKVSFGRRSNGVFVNHHLAARLPSPAKEA